MIVVPLHLLPVVRLLSLTRHVVGVMVFGKFFLNGEPLIK